MMPPYLTTGLTVMAIGTLPFVLMMLIHGGAMKGTGFNRVLLGALLGTGLGGLVGGTITGALFWLFEAPAAETWKLGLAVGGLAALGGFFLFNLAVAGSESPLKPTFFLLFFLTTLLCTSPLLPVLVIGYPLAWIVKRKGAARPLPRPPNPDQDADPGGSGAFTPPDR